MGAKTDIEAGFQLVAKDFHTGGMIVDKVIDGVVTAINHMDINKDGVADITEFAPILLSVVPKVVALWNMVNTETLAQLIAASPVFSHLDNAKVLAAVNDIAAAVKQVEAAAAPKSSS